MNSRLDVEPKDRRVLARRGFFAYSLAAISGVGAWLLGRGASAQQPWNPGRGMGFPEGGAMQGGYGGAVRTGQSGGRITTYAVGEEGGGTVTTQAVGEEGGYYPPRRWRRWNPGPVTTYAVGEEGGGYPPPRYTTYALGEEGGGYYRRW